MRNYETFEHGGDYTGQYLDFSASISPLGVPASVKAALADLLAGDSLAKYPDPFCTELREKLAEREGLGAENILCGNGSAELIYRLVHALKPQKAVIIEPAFSLYEKALAEVGCAVEHYFIPPDYSPYIGNAMREEIAYMACRVDESVCDMLKKDVDLLVFASPMNPTGELIDRPVVRSILKICKKNGITVLWDAAFLEFAPKQAEELDILRSAVQANDNLVVLRSFTKYFGMAGVRLGYCMSSDIPLLERVSDMGVPWSVSTVAQTAGIAALDAAEYEAELEKILTRERRQMKEFLYDLTLECGENGFSYTADGVRRDERTFLGGDANYFLLRTELDDLPERLLKKGMKVRSAANFYGLDEHWVRFCLRSRQDNRTLKNALKEVLDGG